MYLGNSLVTLAGFRRLRNVFHVNEVDGALRRDLAAEPSGRKRVRQLAGACDAMVTTHEARVWKRSS
jgi:hypothetical protein